MSYVVVSVATLAYAQVREATKYSTVAHTWHGKPAVSTSCAGIWSLLISVMSPCIGGSDPKLACRNASNVMEKEGGGKRCCRQSNKSIRTGMC